MTEKQELSTRSPADRARPRWARVVHDLGDDVNWAMSAWCDFPRPIRRATAVLVTAVGGRIVGADEAIASLVTTLTE